MIRLGALMLALLVVIGVTLIAFGSGNERASRAAQTEEVRPASADPEAQNLIDQIKSTVAPEEEETEVPAAAIVQAESQTPQRVERFPGPALRPSPEHEGREAAGDQAADMRANAQGPILYVTGSRVNFRSGPSTSASVVGALSEGAPAEALGPTDGDWVHIRDSDGREGYMSAQFLSAAQ